jgi:peptide/nickel transport system substrate-binding protein
MNLRSLLHPRSLLSIPVILLLVIAVACGGDAEEQATPTAIGPQGATAATPTPTPTPLTITGIAAPATPTPTAQPGVSVEATPTSVPEPTPTSPPAADIIYGGHITMQAYANGSPRQVHEWGYPTTHMTAPLANNLVHYNPASPDPNEVVCDLCTSWEQSDDGKSFIFHIHPQANWWDGMPVTAADIEFNFQSMVDPDQFEILTGRVTSSTVQIGNYFESARVIDEKTVEINLKFPSGAFLPALAIDTCMMQPKHTVLDEGKLQTFAEPDDYNLSGPFMPEKVQRDVLTEYVKNPNYFKEGKPYIDGMIHFIIVDSGTVIAAYKTGEILMTNGAVTNLTAKQAVQLGQDLAGKYKVHFVGPEGSTGVIINTRQKPFDDPKVRRAVQLALHRQPVIDTLSGGVNVLGSPLPPNMWFSLSLDEVEQIPGLRELDGEKHPDDIVAARALLAEAGVAEGVSVTLSARNCCEYPDIAAIVAEQLRQNLGWDITIQTMESAAGYQAYDRGEFQFMVQSVGMMFADPDPAIINHVQAGNTVPRWTQWKSDELEDLYLRQQVELDPEKRRALALEMQDYLLNVDSAMKELYWTMRHWIVSDSIQNFYPAAPSNGHKQHEVIWCDPSCG